MSGKRYQKDPVFESERVIRAYVAACWGDEEVREHTNDRGTWLQVPSPYKTKDAERRLGFNVTTGHTVDWSSSISTTFVKFVRDHQGLDSVAEAKFFLARLIAERLGGEAAPEREAERRAERSAEPRALREMDLPEYSLPLSYADGNPMLAKGRAYAARRGLTEEDLRTYDVHYCFAGRYGGRIVFPVRDGGRFVWFQTRTVHREDEEPRKALNPPGPSDSVLFGLENLAGIWRERGTSPGERRVIVVEGPIDTIFARGAGCHGSSLTEEQIARILAVDPAEVIFALDMDMAGVSGTIRSIDRYRGRTRFRVAVYGSKDVGDIPRDRIEGEVVRDALDWGLAAKALLARRAMQEERRKRDAGG